MSTVLLAQRERHDDPPAPAPAALVALAALGLLGEVVALWSAAHHARLGAVGDAGLVPVLPAAYWVGVVLVNVALALSLVRRSPPWLSCLLLACLVLVVYGGGIVVSDVPRGAVSWRHLGIADALATGPLDPRIDVYFNWPGFFAGLATVVGATGLDPLTLALWAPLANIALWALGVAAVVRAFTTDGRLVVVVVWLFLVGNWIDQDYLSPQALGFALHLGVLALLLRVLSARRDPAAGPVGHHTPWRLRGPLVPEHPDARTRVVATLVVLLLGLTLVASHQLSPVMLIVSSAALTALRRSWVPWFPLIMLLALVAWMSFPASAYLAGHPLFGGSSQSGLVGANLLDRLGGTPGHLVVQWTRMSLTAALWLLAVVGAARLWSRGWRDPRPVVLAVAPFLLLPTVSYGGEMLLRVTLFALPFVAYLAAWGLAPLLRRTTGGPSPGSRALSALTLALVMAVLSALSVTARYGNASFDTFSDAEVAAAGRLDDVAPEGSTLVAGAPSTPWASQDYTRYTRRTVEAICESEPGPRGCARALHELAGTDDGLTLLLTRGNEASLRIDGVMSAEDFALFERQVRRLPGTELLYRNRDARLYHLAP